MIVLIFQDMAMLRLLAIALVLGQGTGHVTTVADLPIEAQTTFLKFAEETGVKSACESLIAQEHLE